MQTFYSASQKEGESVTAYGCRLENILQMAVQNGHISSYAKDDMLRSKFWTGLRSDKLKNQTRHKYDSIKSYDLLLKEIRAVDLEINPQVDKVKSSKGQQKSIQSDSDKSEIDKLSDQMKQMFNKMTKLESELKHYSNALGSTIVEQRGTDGGNRRFGRSRGRGRGNDRGKGNDRGRGKSSFSTDTQKQNETLNG